MSEGDRSVAVSKIFHWYASDFGSSERELLQSVARPPPFHRSHVVVCVFCECRWLCAYLPDDSRGQLERMLASPDPITVTARDYNWQLNSDSSHSVL